MIASSEIERSMVYSYSLCWHTECLFRLCTPTGTVVARSYCFKLHSNTCHSHLYPANVKLLQQSKAGCMCQTTPEFNTIRHVAAYITSTHCIINVYVSGSKFMCSELPLLSVYFNTMWSIPVMLLLHRVVLVYHNCT